MLVRHHMTRTVTTLSPDDSLAAALLLLRRKGLRRAPVVEDGELVGMLTERDVLRATGPGELRDQPSLEMLEASHVAAVMTCDPISISANAHLEDAARILLDHRIGALPVVDGGRLVGVVTDSDLLRVFVQQNSRGASTRVTVVVPAAAGGERPDPVRLCLATGVRLRALSACDLPGVGEIVTLHVEGDALDDLMGRLVDGGYRVLEREDA